MRFSVSGKYWRRFRLVALVIIVLFFITCVVFVVSYTRGREKIVVDDIERANYIHLPSPYYEDTDYPLLLVFHRRLGNAWMMREITQFDQLADEEGFIVIYPDGYRRSWADGSQRYESDGAGINDIHFVETLLNDLSSRYSIDEGRVYAAGFSNGGFLTHRLGCELSGQISAIATVSAVLPSAILDSCEPDRPVPVLMIQGDAD